MNLLSIYTYVYDLHTQSQISPIKWFILFKALSNETKYHLSKLMDNETTTCNSHGTLQNYVGLAEYMDLRPEVRVNAYICLCPK